MAPSSDLKVEIVTASGEADMSVSVVGDQVVDLTDAEPGQVLVVQSDGTLALADADSVGSGKVLGSVSSSAQFTMAVDAAEEDVPTMSVTFTYDGRPVRFVLTPVLTGHDDAATARTITLTLLRSTDDAVQRTASRVGSTSVDTDMMSMDTGPLTAWPSDSAAFVVGTPYTVKLRIDCGANSKTSVYGNLTPYTLYVITA